MFCFYQSLYLERVLQLKLLLPVYPFLTPWIEAARKIYQDTSLSQHYIPYPTTHTMCQSTCLSAMMAIEFWLQNVPFSLHLLYMRKKLF